MKHRILGWFLLGWGAATLLHAENEAEVSSLKPSDLMGFESASSEVQKILRYGLDLTTQELRYQYGSNHPKNGGMDCSGTVSHILHHTGYAAPRMAHTIYLWAEKAGTLTKVKDCRSVDDAQLSGLRPGDLLFWEGTYDVGERNPPISHVMIYLGRQKSNGKPVMVGASSGRYYAGKARHGVSVFDFRMPRAGSTSKFVAYAGVPGVPRASERKPVVPVPVVAATAAAPDPAVSGPVAEPETSGEAAAEATSSGTAPVARKPKVVKKVGSSAKKAGASVRGALRRVFKR